MNAFVRIFQYNFMKQIKSTAYKVVTGLMVVLIVGTFLITKFINHDPTPVDVLVVDNTGYFQDAQEWNALLKNSKIKLTDQKLSLDECKDKVLNTDNLVGLYFDENEGTVMLNVIDNNRISSADLQVIELKANAVYEYICGKSLGITDEQLNEVFKGIQCEVTQIDTTFEDIYLVAYCLLILLVMAIMMYGSQVAGEVTYAKTNRVMELLLTSASPVAIFMGITLAIGLAGLLQLGIVLGVGIAAFNIIQPEVLIVDGLQIDFSVLTFDKTVIFILFFIFSYLLYAVLNAGIGSLVSKNEDIMVAILPTTILSMLQMFTGLFAIASPKAVGTVILSYVPFTSAGTMVMTYFTGNASLIEVVISLLILVVSLLVVSFYSIRVFVNGVIYYGNFSYRTLFASRRKQNE